MKSILKTILVFVFILVICSCHEEKEIELLNSKDITKQVIARNQFSSVDELIATLQSLKNNSVITRVHGIDTIVGIDAPIENVEDYLGDGVVNYEYTNISSELLIQDGDMTYYEACGYDTLVPDTLFARVLNIKGEFQVADTVYKISRKGTYFFKADLEPYFTENYSTYESIEGTQISENVLLIDSVGIYRYATFKKDNDEMSEATEMPDDIEETNQSYSTLPNNTFASQVNWSALPTYNSDAKTILGTIWQSIFGRDKSYYHKIANKRRVRGKLYYYDYKVHQSIGAMCELQKKNWIGWSGTKADKLTINWHNIVMQYSYTTTRPDMPTNANPYSTVTNNVDIPSLGCKGKVTSIFGAELSQNELNELMAKGAKTAYNILKSKFGDAGDADSRAFMLYGKQKITVIIPDGYQDYVNTKARHVIFYDNWGFSVSFNLLNISLSWRNFASNVTGCRFDNPKLLCGQIRVGACLNDTWGGMTIEKK